MTLKIEIEKARESTTSRILRATCSLTLGDGPAILEHSGADTHAFYLMKRPNGKLRLKCRKALKWVTKNEKAHTLTEYANCTIIQFPRKEDAVLFKMFWL
jgi:hypothetical protein